jgi:hypothetical protein
MKDIVQTNDTLIYEYLGIIYGRFAFKNLDLKSQYFNY